MHRVGIFIILVFSLNLITGAFTRSKAQTPPNVILLLTDDQGIGDLGCHGNPWLKTPNLDAFYDQAFRLTDFHVSPLCTPTRAAIMTGRYPINNGAWATYKGRDALFESAFTMADVFKQNGYKTGIFGKWHLGDNYPSRPTDCGFELAVHHLAGGVGELSDYWGNSYFNDIYYVNNEAKQFEGYCTDIWFEESMKFIDQNKDNPFFVYLPTNAPHDPLIVAEEYAVPYKHLEGQEIISANLYGMLANIDENFGKLETFLKDKGLVDNTILIFMGDNGSRFGYSRDGKLGYNKGYEGIKGDKLEGGHRVPFFIRWTNGEIEGGTDINELTAHVDLLPTLIGLCKLKMPNKLSLDGIDLSPILLKQKEKLDRRSVFIHHRQDWRPPKEVDQSCILQDQWRLINGNALYDIQKDPKQQHNLTAQHPELVKQLLEENAKFITASKMNGEYNQLPVHIIGNEAQKEIKLTIQHAIGEDGGIWKCEQVAAGMKNTNNTHAIKVEKAGWYKISCCRWPKECAGSIWGTPTENPKNLFQYEIIKPQKARISIANQILEQEVDGDATAVNFTVYLQEGKTLLVNDFIEYDEHYGVYYTYIRKIEE